VLLIGHGSAQGGEARFNLPGPDLTAADFGQLLARFSTQRVALVNAASASGDFVVALSAPNRTIITATRGASEKNETVFGGYFVKAFAGEVADTDKDGQVSLLEAFSYARREVERFYQSENRLQTEHALLDDNGDGEGSRDPDASATDGANARRFLLGLGRTDGRASGPCDDPGRPSSAPSGSAWKRKSRAIALAGDPWTARPTKASWSACWSNWPW
jgi:hypothetical protein